MDEVRQESCSTCRSHASRVGPSRLAVQPGHVLDTMSREHDVILSLLDEVEALASGALDAVSRARLGALVDHLIGAEPHHRREEDVLFPELLLRGVSGPAEVMTEEHGQLRKLKHALRDAVAAGEVGVALSAPAHSLVASLRDHIATENEILYPLALEVVDDDETWERLLEECDAVGYCCFTPERV